MNITAYNHLISMKPQLDVLSTQKRKYQNKHYLRLFVPLTDIIAFIYLW